MHAEISEQVDKVSNRGPLYDPAFRHDRRVARIKSNSPLMAS